MWQRVLSRRWLQADNGMDRPLRVLVESQSPVAAVADYWAFRLGRMDVAVCSGPGGDADECPLVRGEPCPFAEQADAVLVELDISLPSTQRIVAALTARHPDTSVVVEVADGDTSLLPEGAVSLAKTASVNEQVRVLRRAAIDARRTGSLGAPDLPGATSRRHTRD